MKYIHPKYKSTIGKTIVLWFFNSNRYVIADETTNKYIELFLTSNSFDDFENSISIYNPKINSKELYLDIESFLIDSNKIDSQHIQQKYSNLDQGYETNISYLYSTFTKPIQVNYASQLLKSYLHPNLSYLLEKNSFHFQLSFNILENDEHILLYKNQEFQYAFLKKDYHKLQGKFNFLLLCELYNKQESDWLGTFHASTLGNEKEALMLIGDSGNGKSTLSALLMAHGLDLISDDITAMLADNLHVYRNPNAISIKQGAFEVLKPYFPKLDSYDDVFINNTKGYVKYIPPSNTNPKKFDFPCNKIVLVKYDQNTPSTSLSELNPAKALETLIPESWISPNPKHAKLFLNWLETVEFYSLTYNNNEEAISKFKSLFSN
ncbi:hypothetical protein [Mangrovimonas sp. TPBH4]|uniref:hypothetical protein n=1 Tax=Mangrovimonas sp. TPBH4 TaxID=1645914 RepID=UPI0006B5CC52|nr:hypothetical protein [Mangrovimonas sp. TPBH4]